VRSSNETAKSKPSEPLRSGLGAEPDGQKETERERLIRLASGKSVVSSKLVLVDLILASGKVLNYKDTRSFLKTIVGVNRTAVIGTQMDTNRNCVILLMCE